MAQIRNNLKQVIILAGLSYFFFMFGNGIVALTNPDEVFYAQIAKEMASRNSWMTQYLFGAPQFEKPILTYWLLRLGFILFGINGFAARFFPALFAMAGVISVYFLGLLGTKSKEKAFLSSIILMSSGLYVGLARSLFTDMIFSVCILLSLLSFFWGYASRKRKAAGLVLFFAFSGLAVLAKGPLGFLLPFFTVIIFLLIKKELEFLFSKFTLWGIFIFALISLPWYIFMASKYSPDFVREFFYNDHIRRLIEAEHIENDHWYFYPLAMLVCMFPWSLYVGSSLAYIARCLRRNPAPFYSFLASWLIVVFSLFQFAHSKLASYIFPLFPALALIAGDFIYTKVSLKNNNRQIFLISLANVFILFLLTVGLIIGMAKYPAYIPPKIPTYCSIAAFLALIVLMLSCLQQHKLLTNIYLSILVIPVFLCAVPFLANDISPYISSQKSCEYLLKNYRVDNTILCSKFFVRGVRYYTGKEVAVIDIPGKSFFSPHPILFLDTDQKVRDFLRRQEVTYCILKKSSLEDIERITAKEFRATLLKAIGNEYILKIEE